MKRIILLLLGILLIGVLLFACAPGETPASMPSIPDSVAKEKVIAKEGWEAEWEKTLTAARKEEKAVVYAATPAPTLKEAVPILKEKFGLSLEVLSGRGAELTAKLRQEKAAGLHIVDVVIAGPATTVRWSKAEGFTMPIEPALILPEVLDQKAWFGGKLPWVDNDRHALAFYFYPSGILVP